MRKEKSWTRQEYDNHCRWMRRGFTFKMLIDAYPDQEAAIKAADYSYQAWGYEPNGWVSEARRKRFSAIKYRITSSGEYLPF